MFLQKLMVQGTEVAAKWDLLYYFLVILSAFFFILVVGAMIFFALRYRKSVHPKPTYIDDNHVLETLWTVIPTILLLVIFGWGYYVYDAMVRAPSDAYEVRVIAKQWLWQFQYADGKSTIGELYVPVNQPVKLVMTSTDVVHSFFVPNFRIKQDVVPGMYTSVWFKASQPGTHQIFCTEYCGADHSGMLAQVIALEPDQWEAWQMNGQKPTGTLPVNGVGSMGTGRESAAAVTGVLSPLAQQGKTLSETKGCMACHSVDGTQKVGPTYKGIFGHEVELADGTKVTVDEAYLKESIEVPTAKVVKGFAPSMPPFKGVLTDTEIDALVAYIKEVK